MSYQVEKLMATGQSERQAVESVKRMQYQMKKNPDMFLQPFIYENGHRKPNPAFRKRYGDPEKIWADTHKNVGRSDEEQRLEMEKEIEDRRKSRLGIKYII